MMCEDSVTGSCSDNARFFSGEVLQATTTASTGSVADAGQLKHVAFRKVLHVENANTRIYSDQDHQSGILLVAWLPRCRYRGRVVGSLNGNVRLLDISLKHTLRPAQPELPPLCSKIRKIISSGRTVAFFCHASPHHGIHLAVSRLHGP
jgi:hypothetical protein